MKKSRLLIPALAVTLLCASCSANIGGSSSGSATSSSIESSSSSKGSSSTSTSSSSSTSSGTSTSTSATSDKLYDTSGNEIKSGSASVSFVYGRQTTTKTISAAYLIDGAKVEITSGEYVSASSSSNQVVFLVVNGGTLSIKGSSDNYVSVSKSGSAASNGQVSDDYNFYGINSGIVVSGSTSSATIEYADIVTSSNGSNAVVATNDGQITISSSSISTSGSAGSRGLHTTYGGDISANNVKITTQGASCAALANDRGGGSIVASNMELETNSNGSPLIYSTDSITVTSSSGTANKAQMVVVEGGSSATLTDCSFSCSGDGNRSGTSDSSSSTHVIDRGGIFIYQSFSGDSSEGTDYFSATSCTFVVTTSDVPMFYLTNITAVVTLSDNSFTQASSSDYLMVAEATDQWGTTGKNGASVTVKLSDQDWDTGKTYSGLTSSISYK